MCTRGAISLTTISPSLTKSSTASTPTAPSVVMANVVGGPEGDPRDRQADALAAEPGANIHLYGKSSRPGRKIGHVTVLGGEDLTATRRSANLAADTLAGA